MKEKMVNMKTSLARVSAPGAAKRDTQEMMEVYIVQCEKAITTGKKNDLPKRLQSKLEELQRARENAALVVWKYRASASTRASHQGRSRGSRVT